MDTIIIRGAEFCFANNIIQSVALNILQNPENSVVCESLKFLSLKSVMAQKMKKDVYSNVLFSLIFREPIRISDFQTRSTYRSIYRRVKRKMFEFFTGFPKKYKIYQEMKKDPFIMQEVFRQNIPYQCGFIRIMIEKTVLRIDYHVFEVVEIAHRDNIDYDIYWAIIFTNIVLSKSTNYVELTIRGDENLNMDEAEESMNNWISSIDRKIPSGSWKNALENGNQLIYMKDLPWQNHQKITTIFQIERQFHTFRMDRYFGYVE